MIDYQLLHLSVVFFVAQTFKNSTYIFFCLKVLVFIFWSLIYLKIIFVQCKIVVQQHFCPYSEPIFTVPLLNNLFFLYFKCRIFACLFFNDFMDLHFMFYSSLLQILGIHSMSSSIIIIYYYASICFLLTQKCKLILYLVLNPCKILH